MKRLGDFRFSTAPLTQRKTPSQAQLYARETMRVAAWFQKLMFPDELDMAKEIASNGPWTWKDVYIAHLFGTLIEFTDDTGQLWQGRRILAAEIQAQLDQLSSTPGAMLLRDTDQWRAIQKGSAGYNMTMDPATEMPNWLPPAAPTTLSDMMACATGGTPVGNGTSSATVAEVYIGLDDILIKDIEFFVAPASSPRTYRALIANLDTAGKILFVKALSPDVWTTSGTSPQSKVFAFPTQPVLAKGTIYGLCLVRTDSTATATANSQEVPVTGEWPIPGLPQNHAQMFTTFAHYAQKFFYNSTSTNPTNVSKNSTSTNHMVFNLRFMV